MSVRSLICTLLFTIAGVASAETPPAVQILQGKIHVMPSAVRTRSIIAFESDTRISEKSNQIVFLIQHKSGSELPFEWAGHGRLAIAEGTVGLMSDTGTRQLFKFDEAGMPPSLSTFKFKQFAVFGIARYGEARPLTQAEISELADISSCADPRAASANLPEKCTGQCDSGGEGSTTCSLQANGLGCSTTCRSGYYACCWWTPDRQPRCLCCQIPPP
jgi:hypothetical protein